MPQVQHLVPAVMTLRLPRPADPARVEALLARAMAAADPPMAAELASVPLFSAAHPADPPVLTYALVLQTGSALAARDHHDLLAGVKRAARKALKSAFGPGTKVAIRVADSPDILAACSRAIAGNPRAGNPYQA
jgi:hypothetical protein